MCPPPPKLVRNAREWEPGNGNQNLRGGGACAEWDLNAAEAQLRWRNLLTKGFPGWIG